jgi:hypothetical protein
VTQLLADSSTRSCTLLRQAFSALRPDLLTREVDWTPGLTLRHGRIFRGELL